MELRKGVQTETARAEIMKLTVGLENLLQDQAMYWRQRGNAAWMKDRDKNTSFFHAKPSSRRQINKTRGLRYATGQWVDKKEQMEVVVEEYFKGLFSSTRPSENEINEVLQSLAPRMTEEANHSISKPFTEDKVTNAISSMSPFKSPGLDGFPALFNHKYWSIIGANIIACTLALLNHMTLPAALNFTYIVLIPKIKNPQCMADFRPISLCNVLYKLSLKPLLIASSLP